METFSGKGCPVRAYGTGMKILLVSTNRNPLPVPVMPIGACIVAHAAERSGHTVHLLDLMFTRDAKAEVESAVTEFRPDLVGVSVRNIDNNDMRNTVFFLDDLREIVNVIRAGTGAPILLGGAALGVMPEEILRLGDVSGGVLGDGETIFPLLADRISRGGSLPRSPRSRLYRKRDLSQESPRPLGVSAACPAPDYHRWLNTTAYRSHLATVPIQTKTGCPFQCVYCTYPRIEGSTYRLKDPGSVADAVARLAATGLRDIEIVDSVFNAPLEHAMNVCAALARVRHRARLQCLELNPLFP